MATLAHLPKCTLAQNWAHFVKLAQLICIFLTNVFRHFKSLVEFTLVLHCLYAAFLKDVQLIVIQFQGSMVVMVIIDCITSTIVVLGSKGKIIRWLEFSKH